tara:strand:+ start:2034 stop:2438 length:405 start_codon:yes stop_codon:yes gene_type:complete
MSTDLKVSVVTQEGEAYESTCDFVKFSSVSGEVGVTLDHISSVIDVNFTDVFLEDENDEVQAKFFVGSGIVSIRNNVVTFLCNEFLLPTDIDQKAEKLNSKEAKEAYANAKTATDKQVFLKNQQIADSKLRLFS